MNHQAQLPAFFRMRNPSPRIRRVLSKSRGHVQVLVRKSCFCSSSKALSTQATFLLAPPARFFQLIIRFSPELLRQADVLGNHKMNSSFPSDELSHDFSRRPCCRPRSKHFVASCFGVIGKGGGKNLSLFDLKGFVCFVHSAPSWRT